MRRNPDIRYINPDAPSCAAPEIVGRSYTCETPATLDLAERAALAVHGLTSCTDPDFDGELYWAAGFGWRPPGMYHDANDWVEAKLFAPSLLLRQACGSTEHLEVEAARMGTLRRMQGPDGLLYIPLVGRPWSREFGGEGDMFATGAADHFMPLVLQGRYLSVAGAYHGITGDPAWLAMGAGILRGLRSLLIGRDGCAYFQKTVYAPGEARVEVPPPPPYISHGCAWVGNGLIEYHRMTGNEEALEMACRLARLFADGHTGFIGPGGEFRGSHGTRRFEDITQQGAHFHCNTHIRILLLNAGLACGDRRMVDLARAGYAFGKRHGDDLMGYFPENVDADRINPDGYGNTAEACEVAEMIYLALRQSTAGVADCWDDVDRWMRNMFAESQLVRTDWVAAYSEKHGVPLREDVLTRAASVLASATSRDVPQRARGCWGGFVWPNEWQGDLYRRSVMHCCTGNMGMHFYRVWRDMVAYDAPRRRFTVHLLMNRAAPWADVLSYVPNRGQVDVVARQDLELALRIPAWTTPIECAVARGGQPVACAWEGRYAVVGARAGDRISLRFPIAERVETRTIMSKPYRLTVRGHDIVDIDPPGAHCPIFRRPAARLADPPMRVVTRFLSERVMDAY